MHNNTRKQFVKGIAETDRTKVRDQIGVGHFRNKDQVCDLPVRRDSEKLKNFLNNLNNARTQTRPVCLEKESMIFIRFGGLERGEGLEGLKNFSRLRNSS